MVIARASTVSSTSRSSRASDASPSVAALDSADARLRRRATASPDTHRRRRVRATNDERDRGARARIRETSHRRHVRPELTAPADVFYNDTEARKYSQSSRVIEIQSDSPSARWSC